VRVTELKGFSINELASGKQDFFHDDGCKKYVQIDWRVDSRDAIEPVSVFSSNFDIFAKLLLSETVQCDQKATDAVLVGSVAAGVISALAVVAALVYCKLKRRACFSQDGRIEASSSEGDKQSKLPHHEQAISSLKSAP